MKLVTEFLEWNDNLYEVIRIIRENHKPIVEAWKSHLNAETVLRKGEFLYFCRKIEDAQIIEESDESISKNITENIE